MSALEPLRWYSAGEHEMPADLRWLAPSERERADGLCFAKRRADYLLGRFTAKRAVAQALEMSPDHAALRRIEVRNRTSGPERGAPVLFLDGKPARLDASITDRAGWGVCLLAPAGFRMGCDLELVEPRSDAFVADFLTPRERTFVAQGGDARQRHARANLLWSAKESVLKLLRTGLRRDTRSVEVTIREARAEGDWQPLEAQTVEGGVFCGWWREFGVFLLTVAYQSPAPAPRSLVEPPGLVGARPSHRWLERPWLGATA